MKNVLFLVLAFCTSTAFALGASNQSVDVSYTKALQSIDMGGAHVLTMEADLDVDTPAAVNIDGDTEVDVTANTLTSVAHGLYTGLKGQASSDGTLPAGLSTATDYFVIVVDADTFKLATSLANALAGTAIDITDTGTAAGTHTFTPTSIAGGNIKLEASNSGSNWTELVANVAVTADANVFMIKIDPGYRFVRPYFTLTAGHVSGTVYIYAK